jgi:D-tyrosyl-tRNA(Tyr) deacylase
VIQRVKSASVTVDGQLVSSIGKGLLVLAAVSKDDIEKDVETMASKILRTKFWDDDKDPVGRVRFLAVPADSQLMRIVEMQRSGS